MPVPDFQSLMLPLLELAADGREHSLSEARDALAGRLGVSEEERAELLPSGRQAVYDNRVAWAKTYLSAPPAALISRSSPPNLKIRGAHRSEGRADRRAGAG